LNVDIAKLNAQIKTCNEELEKVKFSKGAYLSGRHPKIKDGLGFQKGVQDKSNGRHEGPKFVKKKGKTTVIQKAHSCDFVAYDDHAHVIHSYAKMHAANVKILRMVMLLVRPIMFIIFIRLIMCTMLIILMQCLLAHPIHLLLMVGVSKVSTMQNLLMCLK
jgi:hypothetical protein